MGLQSVRIDGFSEGTSLVPLKEFSSELSDFLYASISVQQLVFSYLERHQGDQKICFGTLCCDHFNLQGKISIAILRNVCLSLKHIL
jgi:hypothetical protein